MDKTDESFLIELSLLSDSLLSGNPDMEKVALAAVPEGTKKKETEACVRWQKNKNQADFDFLWKSLQPVVNKSVNKFTYGSPIPQSAFKGETMKLFVKALETFNPSMGTSVSTHLTYYLQKLYRFNLAYQNTGRISSEGLSAKINTYKNRKSFLEDKLSRPPTGIELADDLGWPIKDVDRIERDMRKDIFIGTRHYVEASGPSTFFMDKLNTLYMFESNPKEKLVLEYTYGFGGKPQLKSNIEIAKKIGITPNRVSQIKNKLAKKLKDK